MDSLRNNAKSYVEQINWQEEHIKTLEERLKSKEERIKSLEEEVNASKTDEKVLDFIDLIYYENRLNLYFIVGGGRG